MAIENQAFTARDLQAGATVYTKTADAATAGEWKFLVMLGDGTGSGDDPDQDAGTISARLTINGQVAEGGLASISKDAFGSDTPVRFTLTSDLIANGETIAIYVITEHASDGAVKVAVYPRACVGQTGDAYVDTTELLTRVPDATPGAENGLPILDADLRVKADTEAWKGTTVPTPSQAGYPIVQPVNPGIYSLIITGPISPDATGIYYLYGTYSGYAYYCRADGAYYLFYCPANSRYVVTTDTPQVFVPTRCWICTVTNAVLGTFNTNGIPYVGSAYTKGNPVSVEEISRLAPNDAIVAGVDASGLASVGNEIKEQTDKMGFTSNRIHALSQPTSGIAGDTHFAFDLDIDSADAKILSGDSEVIEEVQEDDRIKTTTEYTSALLGTQWQITTSVLSHDPAYTELIGDPTITYSSSNESVATVDASGLIHHVDEGTCLVIGVSEAIGISPSQRVEKEITNSQSGGQTTTRIVYTPHSGGVRESATDAIDDRIAVEGKEKAIFSTQDHSTPAYVRNTDCWAAGLNLTGISPWNSNGGVRRAGTLISPRHIILAAHYPLSIGDTVRFVDSGNTVIDRTIAGVESLGWPAAPDFQVCVLNADATGCDYAKVLPSDWADYLPNEATLIPVFGLDQEEKALVRDINTIGATSVSCQVPTDETRLEFYETVISGDSGNPSFVVISDELVLLSVWTYGGAGSGHFISAYKSEIEAAMVSLGGGYSTLTEIDLSGFNTY